MPEEMGNRMGDAPNEYILAAFLLEAVHERTLRLRAATETALVKKSSLPCIAVAIATPASGALIAISSLAFAG